MNATEHSHAHFWSDSSSPRIPLSRTQVFWILNAAGWLLFGWIDVLLDYRSTLTNHRLLVFHAMAFGAGFIISVPMRYIFRATYNRSRAPLRNVLAVMGTCLVAANLWEFSIMYCAIVIDPHITIRTYDVVNVWYRDDWLVYVNSIWDQLWPFVVWSGFYYSIRIWLDNRYAHLRRERAEQMAREAQLDLLRFQINPHFLFNTLNAVRAMIIENPEAARQMTSDIAAFYRQTLTETNQTTVPLSEELRMVSRYLTIEKHRFNDRLVVETDVGSDTEDILIPSFTVLPLVENAIKHGMRTSSPPLHVKITCRLKADALLIEVTNSGAWRHHDQEATGSGLRNLQERLAHMYGDRFQFDRLEKDGQVCVTICIADVVR